MGETHRGGKVATRVACLCNGQETGKLFYKPRDAIIDASVIQLFQDINNLPQDEQHPRPSLPVYKIMNCQSHDGTPASIWEYIEGGHPDVNVEDFVQNADERVSACAKHMESVCRVLGVSDLHRENVIVRSTTPTTASFLCEIVPVDLESLQIGKGTGMFDLKFQPPPLSDQEHRLIDQCREGIKAVQIRYVPVDTGAFEGALSDYRQCIPLKDSIIKQLTTDGYRLQESRERLEFLILQDLVRGDVPYCTMQGEMIYWEPQHEVIAKKQYM